MGFNRRKPEDQRREAAEKEAATRRATDAQVLEDAERLIARLERAPGITRADDFFADDRRAPYKCADFPSDADCIVGGRAEVDTLKSLAPDVWWQCVPGDDDQRRENHRDEGER